MKNSFKVLIIAVLMTFTSSLAGQVLIKEDINFNRVETIDGFFYVDDNGRYDGPYMNRVVYPDGSVLTVSGSRQGSKNVGRKVIKLNGQIVMIRVYDKNGTLVRSTKIKPSGYAGNLCMN